MPLPLSVTLMRRTPPSCASTDICVAPASREFSTSSLTTEAGLSTTSPAAILETTSGNRICMDILSIALAHHFTTGFSHQEDSTHEYLPTAALRCQGTPGTRTHEGRLPSQRG